MARYAKITRYATITRFTESATQDVRREFAKALVAALGELKISGGDNFIVMDPDYLDELRDMVTEADRHAQELTVEAEANADLVRRAQEVVRDYELGIRDKQEMTDLIKKLDPYEGD